MNILILEPFFTGSHQQWAEGFQKHSTHQVEILSLSGHHWKWRMHGGAIALADLFLQKNLNPDLILATDMLDLNVFLSLTRKKTAHIPTALYFHENQLTYPWSPTDEDVKKGRDNHYAFINYTSALAADAIFFNSKYHQEEWLGALPNFLNQFPDYKNLENIEHVKKKCEVLHLGMDLKRFDDFFIEKKGDEIVLLWNHRWEYDKNPDLFFKTLFRIKEEGLPFQLIVVGESYKKMPPIFEEAKEKLKDNIIHFGFAKDWETYAKLIWQADILPVTSNQDFFGGSVVEAIYARCYPLLPMRLAYQEHIPEDLQRLHFYKTEEEFGQKLKQIIFKSNKIKETETLQNFVSRYDWSILAPLYDECLFSLIKN